MVASASSRRTRAVNPSRLNRFLDSNFQRASLGSAPMLSVDRPPSIYDPSISWDGLSVDPRPFSRFDARPARQGKATKPVGMAGSRVVELDPVNDGTVFALPVGPDRARSIPLTAEQIDSTRRTASGCDSVIVDEVRSLEPYDLCLRKA